MKKETRRGRKNEGKEEGGGRRGGREVPPVEAPGSFLPFDQ